MTLTEPRPLPDHITGLYAHMGVEALALHLEAVATALAAAGVEITPTAQVGLDEIAESVIEHHARHNKPALTRHLALVAPGVCAATEGV